MVATKKGRAPAKRGAARKAVPAPDPASRSANPERGEHTVTLLGKPYLLRPTYQAQIAIEQKTGRSYAELAMDGQTGALKIEHARVVVAELVNAAATGPMHMISEERAGEMIYEEGLPAVAAVITVAIIDALMGGRKVTGEARAAVA